MAPSTNIKAGTRITTFHPKKRVNMMSQKLVNSTFGKALRANLDTSITAIISPILATSKVEKRFLLLLKVSVFMLLSLFILPGIGIPIGYRLGVTAILTVFTVYIQCPVCAIFGIRCTFSVYDFDHDTIFSIRSLIGESASVFGKLVHGFS